MRSSVFGGAVGPRVLRAACLLLCIASGAARADEVVLANGRKMRGTIVREDDSVVVLRVDGLGEMKLARSDVREIVRSKDKPAPPPPPPAAETGKPEAPPASAKPPTPAASPTPASDADDPLSMRRVWRYEQGKLGDLFESVARQAGLVPRPTPAGQAMIDKSTCLVAAWQHEMTLYEALLGLQHVAGGSKLFFRVHDGVLEAGTREECDGESPRTRGRALVWRDRRGDATGVCGGSFDPKDLVRPDLVETSVGAKGGALEIRLRFAEDVLATLGRKTSDGVSRGYRLVEVWLDADGDSKTGAPIEGDKDRAGWEKKVSVDVGFNATVSAGRTTQQAGDVKSVPAHHTVTGFFATYDVAEAAGSCLTARIQSPDEADRLTAICGAEIVASVPYAKLGLVAGRRVRVVVVDLQQEGETPGRITMPGELVLE